MKIIILFLSLWLTTGTTGIVFGEKIKELPEIINPNPAYYPIIADGNQLIITDGIKINIYSLKDFSLQKQFGKAGEGPQEFMGFDQGTAVRTEVSPDYIIVNSLKKVSFFTRDGNFVKEKLLTTSGWDYKPMGKNFVGYGKVMDNDLIYDTINIYDSELNKIKEIYRHEKCIQPQPDKKINLFLHRRSLPLIYDNKIFLNGRDGIIHVFDHRGKELKTIDYPYEKVRVLKHHKDETLATLKMDPRVKVYYELFKARLEFPTYFPPIRNHHISDKKIYVLTYLQKDGKSEFVIFDIDGKFLKKIRLPIAYTSILEESPYTIHKGKLYQLVDNQETERWELHMESIYP